MRSVLFSLLLCISSTVLAVQPDTPKVVLETNFGEIVIELFPDDAPITVTNFLKYVNSGYYNNTVFHRVDNNLSFSIIQSGGFYRVPEGIYYDPPSEPNIINESYNGLSNTPYTIAMARTLEDPNSANAQFFINHTDNSLFDRNNYPDGYGFCVFGQVINGTEAVDQIAILDTIDLGGPLTQFPYPPLVQIYQAHLCTYVATDGDDTTGIGTPDEPFATIQKAIDTIQEPGHVILKPGTYTGTGNRDIDFNGKAISVTSINPSEALNIATTIIDCQATQTEYHRAFLFNDGEDANSVLQGLTITGGFISDGAAIVCYNSSPTIKNCIIVDNNALDDAGAIYCLQAAPIITNCVFTENSAGNHGGSICSQRADPKISNSIFFENTAPLGPDFALLSSLSPSTLTLSFNSIRTRRTAVHIGYKGSLIWGPGNTNDYPHFVDPKNRDYHLKSQYLRWDTTLGDWVNHADNVTSKGIEAGNPTAPLGFEPKAYSDYNTRINIGAYGGTARASIAWTNWGIVTDLTNDGIVNFSDFVYLADHWLQSSDDYPADFDSSQIVDCNDLALFPLTWLSKTGKYWVSLADFNSDGIVNFTDYSVLAFDWRKTADGLVGDLATDGTINEIDLLLFAESWLQ